MSAQVPCDFVKTLKNWSKHGFRNRPKVDPHVDTKHVQNNLQPHTSPLTRIHGVKLPVRLDYSQNEYNRLNSKLNAFRFESACIFKLRSSYLKHTISYNKCTAIVHHNVLVTFKTRICVFVYVFEITVFNNTYHPSSSNSSSVFRTNIIHLQKLI